MIGAHREGGRKMKLGSKSNVLVAIATALAFLLRASSLYAAPQAAPRAQTPPTGQSAPATKPVMAEEVFKNVQVLRGIPVDEFMATMGFIAASLSLNCLDCHTEDSGRDPAKYADDTPIKQTARKMLLMVKQINAQNFGGVRTVTCYTCHRSDVAPRFTPSLAEQYGTPPDRDPNDVEVEQQPDPSAPTADQILDKYIQALGGEQRLAALTGFTATGTYSGYDTDFAKKPAEVYAKAPGLRTTVIHPPIGQGTTVFDGRNGWVSEANSLLPLVTLTGGELDAVTVEAELAFPAKIKQYLAGWRAGFPQMTLNDRSIVVVQGTAPAGSRVKLFFDKNSGLLVRMVMFTTTVLGLNPREIDYSDYREIAGVKIPFKWTAVWTDGRSEFEMNEIKPNVPIAPAIFAKPTPATVSVPRAANQ
jgi:photosynthetic reaction center cytochrome c subunit